MFVILCLPLRILVLLWGYVKLVSSAVFIPYVWKGIYNGEFMELEAILLAVATLVAGVDIAFDLILICGAHLKRYKLLIAYNCYNIVLLFGTVVTMCVTITYWISSKPPKSDEEAQLYWKLTLTQFGCICSLVYISVIVRSLTKQIKMQSEMENNTYNRFNNETESIEKV